QWRFRMAEDFSNRKLRTTMQFKAIGLADDDALKIRINDTDVPVDYITRVRDKNGQNVYEGDTLPPFDLYLVDMNWETTGREQPLTFGDNTLWVQLVPAKDETAASAFRFVEMVLGVQADDQEGVSQVDLKGSLDDFAVWSRMLGDDEIRKVYEDGLRGAGLGSLEPNNPGSAKLANGLELLYEFDKADDVGWNSVAGGKSAGQTGPSGVLVTRDDKAPRIGKGAGDFSGNDATLKVHVNDMQRLMRDAAGDMTLSYWFRATSRTAAHTVWAMSNELIPSPRYSTNRSRAILATQSVTVTTPQQAILGLARPGENQSARSDAELVDGKWHHLAVTIDQHSAGGKVTGRLFIDGKPGTAVVIGNQSGRVGARRVSIEELECYVYVRR
ncbi:MAG: LamG-like jellyroll fold domain-containing protein, partial [Planctomycetaceae bacterium]